MTKLYCIELIVRKIATYLTKQTRINPNTNSWTPLRKL